MSKYNAIFSKWCKATSNCFDKIIPNKFKTKILPDQAKPFQDIPGPQALPILGNWFRFLPGIAQFSRNDTQKMLYQLKEKYGEIVRLDGIPYKRPIVFLYSPPLVEKMYLQEGKLPYRMPVDLLQYYFDRRGKHGLGTSQGEEWNSLRSKVRQVILNQSYLGTYIPKIDEVTGEFVQNMREMRNVETLELPDDFMNELGKWSLETICLIALDCRLGCLQRDLPEDHEAQQMINATSSMFELMYKVDRMSLHRIFPNAPQVRQFFQISDFVMGTAQKYVCCAVQRLKKEKLLSKKSKSVTNPSMLERILLTSGEEAAVSMAQDMIAGGVDTIASTLGKALYLIATNPQVQDKLFLEVQSVLPDIDSTFAKESYDKIPYLAACLKETMRMYPPLPGNTRTMCQDIELAGFKIPKGTNVFAAHSIMGMQPEQFSEPQRFIPERWVRGDPLYHEADSYAFLPFGYGQRICVAKRLAEHEMAVFIAKVVRTFKLDWRYGPIHIQHHFINSVKSPLKIKISDR